MKWSCPAWCFGAVLLVVGPVGLRMLSRERAAMPPVNGDQAKAGEALFTHEWQPNDPLSPHGDGLGPVFNAKSCVACHHQGGVGGGGGLDNNATNFVKNNNGNLDGRGRVGEAREGVLHTFATAEQHRETLRHLDPQLPGISKVTLTQIGVPGNVEGKGNNQIASQFVSLSQRNTPALFGARIIDAIPDDVLIAHERQQRVRFGLATSDTMVVPVGRVHRLPDGRLGRFGWKGQTAHLTDFVQAACANELGLGNPFQAQPVSIAQPAYKAPGLDLTQAQCDDLTAFVASLPAPTERAPVEARLRANAEAGKALFAKVGCAECHVANLGQAEGIYSDLLLHRMSPDMQDSGTGYGPQMPQSPHLAKSAPLPDEWRTPPLWGVADSAPYLHDGRAGTLEQAIQMHGGQGSAAAGRFNVLNPGEQAQLVAFLRTLRAPSR